MSNQEHRERSLPHSIAAIASGPARSPRRPGLLDRGRYALRNRIERMIGFLKHFRRLATRYDKTAENFLSFVHLAAVHHWVRFVHTT